MSTKGNFSATSVMGPGPLRAMVVSIKPMFIWSLIVSFFPIEFGFFNLVVNLPAASQYHFSCWSKFPFLRTANLSFLFILFSGFCLFTSLTRFFALNPKLYFQGLVFPFFTLYFCSFTTDRHKSVPAIIKIKSNNGKFSRPTPR